MGLNLLSQPAQAISYNVSGNLEDGGSVSGSFDYNPNNYTNWNISITNSVATALNRTYNTTSSFIPTSGAAGIISDASQLILALNGSDSDLNSRWCSESVETSLNETPKFKAIDK